MQLPKKLFVCCVYSLLLWLCSTFSASLINRLIGGPPGTLQIDRPFLTLWGATAFFMGWILLYDLWYVLLALGCWVAFFPPRRRLAWLAFLLAAFGAGLLASHDFLPLNPWEAEDFDHNIISPPQGPTAIYSYTLACVTAVFSATLCYLAVRRWFQHPPPNNALQRMESGGGVCSEFHA